MPRTRADLGDGRSLHVCPPGCIHVTVSELKTLQALVEGLTNRQIGDRRGLSEHYVRNQLHRLSLKWGASSRVDLVVRALRSGVLK